MKINLKFVSLILIFCLFTVSSVSAIEDTNITNDNLKVNNDGTEDITLEDNSAEPKTFTDLQKLINSTESGGTINLEYDYSYDEGFYNGQNNNTTGVYFEKTLTINGNGHVLDGKNTASILYFRGNDVVLNNITFKNGFSAEDIGALRCSGCNITIINCTFINNHGNGSSAVGDAIGLVGGAAYVFGNNTKIINNNFTDNTIGGSGGGIAMDGENCLIENNTFTGNKALRHMNGGALQVGRGANTIIRGNIFKDNYAGMGGGAIELQHSSNDLIENNIFINNGADYGGALSIYNTSYFTLKNNEFSDNYGKGELGLGGTLRVYLIDFSTTSHISNNTIKNSCASVTGGAFYIYGDNIEIDKNTFIGNHADEKGGGIINALGNDIKISNNEIINNTAKSHGGSIYIDGNNNEIISNNFVNSVAQSGGGAIYAKGNSVTIDSNTFTDCESKAHSGAVYVEGSKAKVSNNDFENNVAATFGGAVYINGANSNIYKNNFLNNKASSNGGAIRITGKAATITQNTFNKNTAPKGSDILIWNGDSSKVTSNKFVDYKSTSITPYGNNLYIQDNNGVVDKTNIAVSSITFAVTKSIKSLIVTLTNDKGIAVCGKTVKITTNGKTYTSTTNSKGKATFKVSLTKLGSYKCKITFAKDKYNKAATKTVTLKVTKEATKITASKKTFKRLKKTKKVVVVLKSASNKVLKNKKVTLKVKGKTYKVKTNKQGKATFKVKLYKKGTFKYTVRYGGNSKYKAVTKSNKIIIK